MWLHIPESFRCAPAEADSTLGSDSLYQALAASASWKTKSLPPQSWSRIWKRAGWTTRLFGQTYEPSTAQRGVERWILSLVDTHASRSVTLGAALEPTTTATSGPPLNESYEMFSPNGASSRTSVLICDSDSAKSPEAFTRWATALRQHCLQRRKSALRTAANDSSSWPTADAAQGGRVQSEAAKARGSKAQIGLANAAAMWPTARASYNENRTTKDAPSHGVTHGATLAGTAGNWQTPNAAAEAPNLGSNIKNGPKSLLAQATWATPVASDDGKKVTSASLQPGLIGQSSEFAGRPDLTPTGEISLNAYGRPRLNPKFVEWLMGWPEGWADLTSYTSSETA